MRTKRLPRTIARTFTSSLLYFAVAHYAGSATSAISTAQLLQTTAKATQNCLDYQLVGTCFWLSCGLTSCTVVPTPKARHYRPDLVIAVNTDPDQHAWLEMRTTLAPLQKLTLKDLFSQVVGVSLASGGGLTTRRTLRSTSLRFFEADVIGHPLVSLPATPDVVLCDAITTPLVPYYQSTLDALAWREPLLDGLHVGILFDSSTYLGSNTNVWGPVTPRCGWVNAIDPVKAAAVAGFRALDIATSSSKNRVRVPITSSGSHGFVPPPALLPNDEDSAKFQLVYPSAEETCTVFGTDSLPRLSIAASNHSSFLWNVWRPYECCPRGGQIFLSEVSL